MVTRRVSVTKSALKVGVGKSLGAKRLSYATPAPAATSDSTSTTFLHEWGNEPYGSEQWRLWWHAKNDPINAAKSQAEKMMNDWMAGQAGVSTATPGEISGGRQTSSFSFSSIPSYVWIALAVVGGFILLKRL